MNNDEIKKEVEEKYLGVRLTRAFTGESYMLVMEGNGWHACLVLPTVTTTQDVEDAIKVKFPDIITQLKGCLEKIV